MGTTLAEADVMTAYVLVQLHPLKEIGVKSAPNKPGSPCPTLCRTFGFSAVAALLLRGGSLSSGPRVLPGAAGQATALHRQDGLT